MEQAAENDPLIGAQVGNYEVKSKLGEGGMGSVYLAEHPLIGKKVALKVLHSEFSSNEDVVSRFFTEAKAVNDIQHPNIVDIIDYGVIPDQAGNNMVYFIMEFLAGRALADVIRQEAPLAPERALAICVQICDALATSHRGNIVHRDLKPDNVILIDRARQPDFVKVLDFGIAKLTGDQPGSRRTRTGIVMGTPAYMSPEQCEGKGAVDHRTDVYALGILLYEMLTGRVPFQGEGYGEVLVQHLTQAPQKPSTIRGVIPPHIEAVCLKALEKSPDARYQSMDDFMQALTDPVQYVEARGGVDGFTSANLGAPTPVTPYPPPAAPPVSPAMGQQTPYTPAPGQLGAVQPGAGQQASWPTPPPRQSSRLPVIVLSSVVALGLAIGLIFALSSTKGGDEAAAAEETEEIEEGTEEVIGEETEEAEEETAEEETAEEETAGGTETEETEETEEKEKTPPPPVMVKVTVESKPPGALVFLEGSKEPKGKTPVTFEVEKGSEKLSVRLERDGYKTREKSFVPSSNSSFEVLLPRERRRVKHGGRGGRDRDRNKDKDKDKDKPVGETGLLPLD